MQISQNTIKKTIKRYNHGACCGDEPWYYGST